MKIRLMNNDDIPTVIEQELLVFGHTLGEYMLEDAIQSDLYQYFVLEEENKIIGYIGLWIVDENGQVMNFYIHPDHQQKGYGTLLFTYGMDQLAKHGVETVSLEVRPSNVAAIHLYKSFGFSEEFRRKKYYPDGEDALYFMRRLGE